MVQVDSELIQQSFLVAYEVDFIVLVLSLQTLYLYRNHYYLLYERNFIIWASATGVYLLTNYFKSLFTIFYIVYNAVFSYLYSRCPTRAP